MIKFNDYIKEVALRKNEYMDAFLRVSKSGWFILGKEVENFEKNLARYLGIKYCVGVGNGLEALQIALMTLGIGEKDEVITTPISAVATSLSIMAVGAKPVFADVNKFGQIDPFQIEKLITVRTKLVIPVHLYGQHCEIDKIKQICRKYKLYLVEDAAQAHGSTYKGKKLGTFGDIGCFSFYPTKNLGAFGDGGALVTNNKKNSEIFRQIRDYGQQGKYIHTRYGLNSRLDELQAAILTEKLKYLDSDNSKRRKLAERYLTQLGKLKDIQFMVPGRAGDSNLHLFVIRTKRRDALQRFLKDKNIPTLIHYPSTIPDQPLFANKYKHLKIPEARGMVAEVLSLPCHPFMTTREVDYVCANIIAFFNNER